MMLPSNKRMIDVDDNDGMGKNHPGIAEN